MTTINLNAKTDKSEMLGSQRQTSLIAYAIKDENRRRILLRMLKSPASLTDLAKEFNLSKPLVSYHLNILYEAGLITLVDLRRSKRGPKKKYYGLTITGMQIVKNVLNVDTTKTRSIIVRLIASNDPYTYKLYKKVLSIFMIPAVIATIYTFKSNLELPLFTNIAITAMFSLALISTFTILFAAIARIKHKRRDQLRLLGPSKINV